MLHDAEVEMPSFNSLFDRRRKTCETVNQRRDASYRPAGVSKTARGGAAIVVRECDDLLRADEARGKKRGAPARGYQDQVHFGKTGEVMQKRGGSKRAAAVQRIRRFGRQHQDLHGVGTLTG